MRLVKPDSVNPVFSAAYRVEDCDVIVNGDVISASCIDCRTWF